MTTLTESDRTALTAFEEELWREETRFDRKRMMEVIAPDFIEFGRSGRTYDREKCLSFERKPILAVIPMPNLRIRLIHPDVAQVTYDSAVTYGGVVFHSRRSSIWTRGEDGWQLRFHQGTPFEKETGAGG